MVEIRQNIATREWVIISTDRAGRPEDFARAPVREREELPDWSATCPFCPGNEELDLERLRLPPTGDWQLRVVQNKYPALRPEGEATPLADTVNHAVAGVGYHEVVVESRRHNTSPALETLDEIERTLLAFKLRTLAIAEDPRIEQIIYFKNHGWEAGSSLVHPHAQLLGLPVVPYSIRSRVDIARRYFDDRGVCVLCQMCAGEEAEGARVIYQSEWFTAFIPYAAFSPFHIWVIPRRHHAAFVDASAEELRDLSAVLSLLLRKIHAGLGDPDYNYVIRTAPQYESRLRYLHWYVSIIPRVSRTAGFEMGSGMFINTSLPEASAAFLRGVAPPAHEAPGGGAR